MTTAEQIPAMDAALAKMDKRIGRAIATIERLNDEVNTRLKRVERVRRYLRQLGLQRSRLATFQLDL